MLKIRVLLAMVTACMLFLVVHSIQGQDNPPSAPSKIEVREAQDSFHREVVRAAVRAQQAGAIKRVDVIRLRAAMLLPSFRKQAEDLTIVQMSAGGSEKTPIGEDGLVDRASINWEGIAKFLEAFIPILLQLLDALSSIDNSQLGQIQRYVVLATIYELAA